MPETCHYYTKQNKQFLNVTSNPTDCIQVRDPLFKAVLGLEALALSAQSSEHLRSSKMKTKRAFNNTCSFSY